jgi:REase_MTES_1575/Transcriptional regulator, AbiEi antitoxin
MPDETHVFADSRGQRASRGDPAVAELADRQYGVVSRDQLRRLGLGEGAIDHRIERGRLHPVHRGVYAVGRAGLGVEGWWMAAVLATGPESVLSHRSAAGLWVLRMTALSITHVTVPGHRRSRRHVIVHRAVLPADEHTVERGIPVTTVARTLFDVASYAPRAQLALAITEAERRGLADSPSLPDLMDRYPRHRGVGILRSVLEEGWVGMGVTRSALEQRFVRFVSEAGLPLPELNATLWVGEQSFEVDCLWRRERLIVELDGYAYHADRAAYERERERDRALATAGWRVIRVTWRQLEHDRRRLAADLSRLLDRGAR